MSTVVGCRVNCNYCPQALHVRKYHEASGRDRRMSLATFQQALTSVPRHARVVFAGMAEPFLNPMTPDFILHAQALGHPVAVYSTLSGMTEDDVERIKHVPFVEFVVHLPDADGRMNLKVDDVYLSLLAKVRSTLRHHYSAIGPVHPLVASVVGQVNDDAHGLISRAGNLPEVGKKLSKTGPLQCSACGPVIDHNVLLPNGDVALCCCDYSLQHVLGNLLTQTWSSLFTGEPYLKLMRGLAGDESIPIACRSCELSVPA